MIVAGRVLKASDVLVSYHSVIDYFALFGSIASDAPIDCEVFFSNDEVDVEGYWVTDRTLTHLNYDVTERVISFDPSKTHSGLNYMTHGRWIKVKLKIGPVAPKELRFYLRGRTI